MICQLLYLEDDVLQGFRFKRNKYMSVTSRCDDLMTGMRPECWSYEKKTGLMKDDSILFIILDKRCSVNETNICARLQSDIYRLRPSQCYSFHAEVSFTSFLLLSADE